MKIFLKKIKLINQILILAKNHPNDFDFGSRVRFLLRELDKKKK